MTTAQIALPPKLQPVFIGEADVRGAYGGRGSGKTRSFAKMAAVRGYMYAMQGTSGQILCARQYMNSLDDSSLEECKRAISDEPWLAEFYEVGDRYIKSRDGRVWFSFAGLDRSIDSIKSKGRILICWVDEAEPVTESAWRTLIPTLREEGDDWNAELWVTWNPKRKNAAVEPRFRNSSDPLVKVVELNWRDNPKFPGKLERERQRDLHDRPDSYQHVWEGDHITIIEGAYYTKQLTEARAQGRVSKVARDPLMTAYAFWDIGGTGEKADACAIWIVQFIGKEIRIIDYYEAVGQELAEHVAWLRRNGYDDAYCVLPHDGANHEKVERVTYQSALVEAGFKAEVVRNQGTGAAYSRVLAVRRLFPQMWFDVERCESGLEAVAWYHEKRDENRNVGLGPCHDWSSHSCLTADSLIKTLDGDKEIRSVLVGDYVLTPSGYAKVIDSRMTGLSVEIIEIKTKDGKSLTVTPEHKIFTTGGVLTADAISYNHCLITVEDIPCIQLANAQKIGYRDAFIESTKALNIGYGSHEVFIARRNAENKSFFIGKLQWLTRLITRRSRLTEILKTLLWKTGVKGKKIQEESKRLSMSLKNLTGLCTTENLKGITNQITLNTAENLCTGKCGSFIMGKLEKAFTSIIKTTTNQITVLKILSALALQNIQKSTQSLMNGSEVRKIKGSLWPLKTKQRTGTEATLAESGIVTTLRKALKIDLLLKEIATTVATHIKHHFQADQCFAQEIVSINRIVKSVPVYDLTIEHDHCYFANGILVSNCDALGLCAVYRETLYVDRTTRPARQPRSASNWRT